MGDDDLRNADLSRLGIRDMTPAQRAELKRRYATFVANFGPTTAAKLPGKATTPPPHGVSVGSEIETLPPIPNVGSRSGGAVYVPSSSVAVALMLLMERVPSG